MQRVALALVPLVAAALVAPAATWAGSTAGRESRNPEGNPEGKASDLNLLDLNRYAGKTGAAQVTSINQFSDVRPTDWAYQALSNLIERYGCVAGYPNGTFKGGQAVTRYEAAALLNACLDRVTEVTDELKRLMAEFEKELALLRGRVDGLEARVGELEATQFATTTQLRGVSRWVLGGVDYVGNTVKFPRYTDPANPYYTPLREGLSFNYDVRLHFDSSFTGKDFLRVTLRAGNFADSAFGALPAPLTQLYAGFQENCGTGYDCGDVVAINRFFYKFPLGSSLTAVVGPRVQQDDLLPVWPSLYNADQILKVFQSSGAPGAYSQLLGAGGGLWWRQAGKRNGWSLGLAYVSTNGNDATPATGGMFTTGAAATGTVQLAYTGVNWNVTGAYTYSGANTRYLGTPLSMEVEPTRGIDNGYSQSYALSGYWQPFSSGWLPSISAGWGGNRIYYTGGDTLIGPDDRGYKAASQSWYVGLIWNDAFAKGNALGLAFGDGPRNTNPDGDTVCKVWFPPKCSKGPVDYDNANPYHEPQDQSFMLEAYYKMQVSDHLAITPALFWLGRPLGQYTVGSGPGTINKGTFMALGYLLQATFRF
ncbi:MAG: iron uptake porin [Cyanobacteriota bacterium]